MHQPYTGYQPPKPYIINNNPTRPNHIITINYSQHPNSPIQSPIQSLFMSPPRSIIHVPHDRQYK